MFLFVLLFQAVFLQLFFLIAQSDDASTASVCADSTPEDCSVIKMANSSATSGIYSINLMAGPCREVRGSDASGTCCVQVFCDMERFGGGWTVFQKRFDGTVDFYRNWRDYEDGFGSLNGEFYLGNKFLYYFTGRKTYELFVELDRGEANCTVYAHYSSFNITNSNNYTLSLGSYKGGTAGDSLRQHNQRAFSTYDRDNDMYDGNGAELYRGAWWYGWNHSSNLNGEYFDGCSSAYATRMNWVSTGGPFYSFKGTQMKLRPAGYSLQNREQDSRLCPKNYAQPSCPEPFPEICNSSTPSDCSEYKLRNPSAPDGIYTIKLMDKRCEEIPGNLHRSRNKTCCVEVFCDMERFGGGWTVFQKRYNGTVDFWRNWKEYEEGFGSLYHEFYLGNRVLYYFTRSRPYELLVELDPNTTSHCKLYAHYSSFGLTNKNHYSLALGAYFNGTAGDALHYHNGAAFSTYDRDNDNIYGNCAGRRKGGWWSKQCRRSSNLNGQYIDDCSLADRSGMVWYTDEKHYTLFKGSEMKLRPVEYKLHNELMDSGLCTKGYVPPECPNGLSKVATTSSLSTKTNEHHNWIVPMLSVMILLVIALVVLGAVILFLWRKNKLESRPFVPPLYFENRACSTYTSQQDLSA